VYRLDGEDSDERVKFTDPSVMSKEDAVRYLKQKFRSWTKGIRENKLPAQFFINFSRLALRVYAGRNEAAKYAGVAAFVNFLNEVAPLDGIGWMRVADMILTKSLQPKKNSEETLQNYLDNQEPYRSDLPLEEALVALGDWHRPGDFQLRRLLTMKGLQDFENLCHYEPPRRKRRWSTGNEAAAKVDTVHIKVTRTHNEEKTPTWKKQNHI
jgi:hypothetical protein